MCVDHVSVAVGNHCPLVSPPNLPPDPSHHQLASIMLPQTDDEEQSGEESNPDREQVYTTPQKANTIVAASAKGSTPLGSRSTAAGSRACSVMSRGDDMTLGSDEDVAG